MPVIGRVQLHNLNRGGALLAAGGSVMLNQSVKQALLEKLAAKVVRAGDLDVANFIPTTAETIDNIKKGNLHQLVRDTKKTVKDVDDYVDLNETVSGLPQKIMEGIEKGKSFIQIMNELLEEVKFLGLPFNRAEARKKVIRQFFSEWFAFVLATHFTLSVPILIEGVPKEEDLPWWQQIKLKFIEKRKPVGDKKLPDKVVITYDDGSKVPIPRPLNIPFEFLIDIMNLLALLLPRELYIEIMLEEEERRTREIWERPGLTEKERKKWTEFFGKIWDRQHPPEE